MNARCAGCDIPVAKVGNTCSLKCYEYMVYVMLGQNLDYEPTDLYSQEWYNEEAEKIERIADTHEVAVELDTKATPTEEV